MRKALQKWLKKRELPEIDAELAQVLCSKLGLEGEKVDSCLAFVYQFEKGDINQVDFTTGLCMLSGKKPEEVMGMLKGVEAKPSDKIRVEIKPFAGHKDISRGGSFTLYKDNKTIGHAMVAFHHKDTTYPISGFVPAKTAVLDTMEINEEERGKGYGSRFIDEIEKVSEEQGMETIYLTSVMGESEEFWRKKGYQFSGHKRIWIKVMEMLRGVKPVTPKVTEITKEAGLKGLIIKDAQGVEVSSLDFMERKDSISVTAIGTLETAQQQGYQTKLWENLSQKGKPITITGLTDAGEAFINRLTNKGFNISKSISPTGMTEYIISKAAIPKAEVINDQKKD